MCIRDRLLSDLDLFKEINDTFGHHCGDLLLTQVGPRLTAVLREVDAVARLGGDEFAVLLPDITDVSAAIGVADKLRAALESPFHIEGFDVEGFDVEGLDLDVEASVGVVLSGEHGADATTLQQRADIAMYVAKSQNLGVFAYDPAVDGHSPAKLALLGTCAGRWPATSWSCTTSPRSASAPGTSSAPRPWSAGSTPTAAWFHRMTSSRWPSTPA